MSGDITSTSDFIMPERPVAQKRSFKGNKYGEPPHKKRMPSTTIRVASGFQWNLQTLALAADAVETGGKSPVSALNEIGVKVAYSIVRQGGPAHCPSFDVAVNVAGMTFKGWGHSKREARAAAARACLSALLARAGRVLPSDEPHTDFTKDVLPKETVPAIQYREIGSQKPSPEVKHDVALSPATSQEAEMSPSAALFGALSPAAVFTKSPINLLYESYPGLSFICTFGDGSPLNGTQAPLQLSHSMRFKVVCQIKDKTYEGYGSSKKLAKLAAARAALAVLDSRRTAPHVAAPAPHGSLSQALADHIANIVNEKFNEVMKHDLIHSKRKVLAGIVITNGNQINGSKVIAVTTGTKCVSGEHMSVRGRALNDCHAEVVARRCLQRHLYAQLLEYAQQPDPSKVIKSNDLEPVPGGGYQMKPSRHVHLYVSTAPCGDSRIFSPHEHREAPDPHPNRQARGQLRTKIESGEGTIPVKNSHYIQTWDGVMQGERLLTMSCSDKVARWCVVGVQGALLSRVLRPVYLHSLVLGSLLHTHHMYRALCGRIESHIAGLPQPFRQHRALLARAASTEARTPARAPSFSVCWCITTPQPEILNATTGKLENGQPSLLCKQTMFARWQHLITKLKPLPKDALGLDEDQPTLPENTSTMLYSEAKMLAPGYQAAKKCLFDAFETAKLGKWIKKPLEQDEFCCEITDANPRHLFA